MPCQDDRQVLEWSKKVIIPKKKSEAGLNITQDASRRSAFVLAATADMMEARITQRKHPQPRRVSFKQSMAFHAAMPISVIAKCSLIECFEGALEEHDPSGLLPA